VPHWNKGSAVCPNGDRDAECGNHNWVEVYTENGWAFVDPDGDKTLNHGWFYPYPANVQIQLTTNHSIFATSWADPSELDPLLYPSSVPSLQGHFPMVWDWNNSSIPAWDVTCRYIAC
jgi:hypothetical protein